MIQNLLKNNHENLTTHFHQFSLAISKDKRYSIYDNMEQETIQGVRLLFVYRTTKKFLSKNNLKGGKYNQPTQLSRAIT